MRVHRLEAVINAKTIRPPADRSILLPRKDRRSIPSDRLEVAPLPRVVGVLLQPVECIPGDLEGKLVARHRTHLTGRVDRERGAINVLFVSELGVEPAFGVDNPVEPPKVLVAHHLIEKNDSVAGILDEFIMMSRRIPGKLGRGPGHAGLIDEKRVFVGFKRPVAGHRLMETTAAPVHGVRVPVLS